MKITWLGFAVMIILAMMGFAGFKRGFIKEILSFFFVFLAVALAGVLNPYVNDFLINNTPVYERIEESCAAMVKEKAGEAKTNSSEGSAADAESEYKSDQTSLIDSLGLPDLLSNSLKDNNTAETYTYLAVDTFADYVAGYLTKTIVNGLSYAISYFLASLVIRIAGGILNLIAQFPIIRSVNKLTGALVGTAKGVVFVWIGLLVLTILCSTEIGKQAFALINQDTFLKILYKYDILVNIFTSVFYGK